MVGRALALIAVLMASGLAVVGLRVAIRQEGYEIQKLDARRRAAERENARLKSRLDETVTATRAEQMNVRLDLGLRPPEQLEGGG